MEGIFVKQHQTWKWQQCVRIPHNTMSFRKATKGGEGRDNHGGDRGQHMRS